MTPAIIRAGRRAVPMVRASQVCCVLAILVLTLVAPVGSTAILLGGGLLAVCAGTGVAAYVMMRGVLPAIQRRIFRWIAVAGACAVAAKLWWTVDLLQDGMRAAYPAPTDFLLLSSQVAVGIAFGRGVVRRRPSIRMETAIDIVLVVVAAVIVFLPTRIGDLMQMQALNALASAVAVSSLIASAGSLLLLALMVSWRSEELSRRATLGLTVGAIAMAVYTAWAAALGVGGQPIPHAGMDVVGAAAILGFVSALDVELQSTLELKVAERTAQLSGALEQLTEEISRERAMRAQIVERERLASIGSIVGGAAHEINNPLSSISAFAQLMLKEEQLTPSQRESIEIMHSEAMRAANVVRDLRAFARRSPGDQRVVDLNELVERILRLQTYQMTTANLRTETDLDEMLPQVAGDPQQLQQVVGNLIDNSIHAMAAQGGGSLTVATRAAGGRVLLEVTDTGPGIPPDARDKIFDPFFTTRAEGEGTGLGLSVSYGIVVAHGGTLRLADSSAGHTRFVVELPAARVGHTEEHEVHSPQGAA